MMCTPVPRPHVFSHMIKFVLVVGNEKGTKSVPLSLVAFLRLDFTYESMVLVRVMVFCFVLFALSLIYVLMRLYVFCLYVF